MAAKKKQPPRLRPRRRAGSVRRPPRSGRPLVRALRPRRTQGDARKKAAAKKKAAPKKRAAAGKKAAPKKKTAARKKAAPKKTASVSSTAAVEESEAPAPAEVEQDTAREASEAQPEPWRRGELAAARESWPSPAPGRQRPRERSRPRRTSGRAGRAGGTWSAPHSAPAGRRRGLRPPLRPTSPRSARERRPQALPAEQRPYAPPAPEPRTRSPEALLRPCAAATEHISALSELTDEQVWTLAQKAGLKPRGGERRSETVYRLVNRAGSAPEREPAHVDGLLELHPDGYGFLRQPRAQLQPAPRGRLRSRRDRPAVRT